MLKYGNKSEFIYLLSELRFSLAEGNVQLPKDVGKQTKQHSLFVRVLWCKNKG